MISPKGKLIKHQKIDRVSKTTEQNFVAPSLNETDFLAGTFLSLAELPTSPVFSWAAGCLLLRQRYQLFCINIYMYVWLNRKDEFGDLPCLLDQAIHFKLKYGGRT